MAEVESPGVRRGVAGVGRVRRKGTPIPVLPPRVPSPMPPVSNTRASDQTTTHVSAAQRKVLAAQMTEKLLKEDQDPMRGWINPRIYSKISQEAVRSGEFPPERVYRPPPAPQRYRAPLSSSRAPSADHAVRDMEVSTARWQIITSAKPVVGEVFIDGPLAEPQHTSIPTPYYPVGTTAQASAAAAFFARAAQKLDLSRSPQRRKRQEDADPTSTVGFCGALHRTPPPPPPALLRRIGVKEVTGVGKVKVMLRVASTEGVASETALCVDKRRKQITLFDPTVCAVSAPEDRRVGVAAPKMFAFDSLFTPDDSQAEVCSSALTDIIHAVINGSDSCLFCYGHSNLGKTQTMLGTPESLGVIPCSIAWLFRGITEQKQKTGARFSVRVSAIEVSQQLRDLLSGHANECEQSPGVYLRDDPLQLQNYSELRAPSADKAAFYLDSALSSRGTHTHFLYTLHVYQYSVATKGAVAGGRSRLHLIDLSSSDRSKQPGGLSMSGLGNVLLAIFNGQKHLPHREHKITQVLKECLTSLTCHVAMIAHVSPSSENYSDTLGTVQLASRVHRIRRRRFKFTGGNPGMMAGEDVNRGTTSSEVDPSSSEQSADTVIYVGPSDETDGEHPPVYLPSMNSGDNRCAMGKALRGSGVLDPRGERSIRPNISRSVPASPQKFGQEMCQINGSHEEKSSPLRVAVKGAGRSGFGSSKSSPCRTATRSKDFNRSPKLNEIHVPEERWIDGPKIPKSKVVEARNLHVMNKDGQHLVKKERWVDGPLNLENGVGYGFMDYHKKSMIRKWVENQTVQIQKSKSSSREKTSPRRYVASFKTYSDEGRDSSDGACGPRGQPSGQEDDDQEEEEVLAPLPQTLIGARNGDISRVVPIERLQGASNDEDEEDEEDEQIEIEIIEVEEPTEFVAMQDSCLQVTEEDIAFCMGQTENPLPEVDQEEHPLRILSQENLTVVSTFTDSLSVANDLERLFPRGPGYFHHTAWLQGQHLRDTQGYAGVSNQRVGGDMDRTADLRHLSRCQSLSLSDMLMDGQQQHHGRDLDTISIVSEPAYCQSEGRQRGEGKFCLNCKGSMTNTSHFSHLTRSISSLRHPDGASNPNLQEESILRAPGNGAEYRCGANEEPRVPPPLQTSLLTLTREGYTCSKMKTEDSSGYASCTQPDSHSQSSIHDPGGPESYSSSSRGWRLRQEQRVIAKRLMPSDNWNYERDARARQLVDAGRPSKLPNSTVPRNSHAAQDS